MNIFSLFAPKPSYDFVEMAKKIRRESAYRDALFDQYCLLEDRPKIWVEPGEFQIATAMSMTKHNGYYSIDINHCRQWIDEQIALRNEEKSA